MMLRRLTLGTAALVVVGLFTACGDDGNDRLVAADEAVEIAIVSGGDAEHGGAHLEAAGDHEMTDDMAADDHDAMTSADHDAMADADHDEMADADHDEMTDDMTTADHDDMAADDHDEMADDMTTADHDEMADDMTTDDHDEMADDDHDEMTSADHDDMTTDDADAPSADGVVINVEMVEFGFVADTTTVPMGQPVTFRFQNTGAVPHEAMFGSLHEQEEFAQEGDHGDGHGSSSHHGDIAAITLDSGESGDIVLEFSSPGELWIGCHLPGHYDAGMVATFTIA